MYKTDHVSLVVQDLDRAIDFYTQKLGLTILIPKEYNEEEQAEYIFLRLGGSNLELVKLHNQSSSNQAKDSDSICPHLALSTDDFEETVANLKEQNIPIFQGPFETPNVSKWLYIKDSEGNVLEFIQWLSTSH